MGIWQVLGADGRLAWRGRRYGSDTRPLCRAKFPDPAPGAEIENLIGVDGPSAVAAVPPVPGGRPVDLDVRTLFGARRAAMKNRHTMYGAAGRISVSCGVSPVSGIEHMFDDGQSSLRAMVPPGTASPIAAPPERR
jgi:hypothetical protein